MKKEDTMITMKRVGLPLILAGAMLYSPLTSSQAADSKDKDTQQQQYPQQPYPYGMGPYGGHMMGGYGMPMWGGGGYWHMREPDMIYGYELMTPRERADYMDRLHNARTFEERDKIRAEHYKLMQERARKRGETLPGTPCPGAGYYGPGGRWR
jgi:hypothetical protein